MKQSANNKSMTAAELLKHRKALGMTQEQLADILGVKLNTVWRWEHPKNKNGLKIPVSIALAVRGMAK